MYGTHHCCYGSQSGVLGCLVFSFQVSGAATLRIISLLMNSPDKRNWKVLCWNVRGINSDEKWNPIRDTIIEANCDVFCFQETKRQSFDTQFIRKFAQLVLMLLNFSLLLGPREG